MQGQGDEGWLCLRACGGGGVWKQLTCARAHAAGVFLPWSRQSLLFTALHSRSVPSYVIDMRKHSFSIPKESMDSLSCVLLGTTRLGVW